LRFIVYGRVFAPEFQLGPKPSILSPALFSIFIGFIIFAIIKMGNKLA